MTLWKEGEARGINDAPGFSYGAIISHSLNADRSNPLVGRTFTVRVQVSVSGGGFPASVTMNLPRNVRMRGSSARKVQFFPLPPNFDPTTAPGIIDYTVDLVATSTLKDVRLTADFFVFKQPYSVTVVLTSVEDPPFPEPMPNPAIGKILFSKIDPGYSSQSWYTIASDGSNPRRLKWKFYGDDAVWSPDGSKIAFTEGDNSSQAQNIYIMDSNAQNVRQLTQKRNGTFCLKPRWSFDGTRILYTFGDSASGLRNSLWVVNADGSGDRQAVNSTATVGVMAGAWMRDGRFAVLLLTGGLGSSQILVGPDDFYSDTDYSAVLPQTFTYHTLASSPHHDFLILQATPVDGDQVLSEVHRWSINGNAQGLSVTGDSPSFSPDGNWVVYSSRKQRQWAYLARVDIDAHTDVQITVPPPDGTDTLFADLVPEWA